MITLRLRGLYAAALTSLFRQYPEECEVVQPDEEVQARLPIAWRMESPDVDIEAPADIHGNRDLLRVTGSTSAVQQALDILQRQCFDVIVQQSASPVGAIYMGLVGIVSPANRRAVVYMGDDMVGLLPLRYEERSVQIGSYIPVRIEAPPQAGEYRAEVSNVLTVPGQYVVLTTAPGVRLSKQITNAAARERLQQLGDAQRLAGWGLIWRTAAQDTDEPLLLEEIQRLTAQASNLKAQVAATTALGYVCGGEAIAQVVMTAHAKAMCDQLRTAIIPTLPGHHKYKAHGDTYHAAVDALEKELPPEMLRARTANLNVLSSVNAMQQPLNQTLQVQMRHVDGRVTSQNNVQPVGYDITAGWVEVRQELMTPNTYPPDFSIEQQSGDYLLTRFHEGAWSYISRLYGRDGTWKGDYARVTTPVAIFTDQIQVLDLRLTVRRSATHTPALTGLEALRQFQEQRVISAALVQRAQAEGEALLQRVQQGDTP